MTTPPTVTLPTYVGQVRYRDLPITPPEGTVPTAATVVSLHTDPDAGEHGGHLVWAYAGDERLLLPLTLNTGQVVLFTADGQVSWVGVTVDVSDTKITLVEHASLEQAWQAALGATTPVVPISDRSELIRRRAQLRVLLLDLDPKRALKVLTALVDATEAMQPEVATAVLNRVHNLTLSSLSGELR